MKAAELSKYTKEEIINALSYYDFSQQYPIISDIAYFIEQQREKKAYKTVNDLSKKSMDLLSKYTDFMRKMSSKYGDGKSFNLNCLTQEELNLAGTLLDEWKKADRDYKKADDKFCRGLNKI